MKPRPKVPLRRWALWYAILGLALFVFYGLLLYLLLAAFLTISSLERSTRKQFAASQQQWFGALAAALTDPSHRPHWSG